MNVNLTAMTQTVTTTLTTVGLRLLGAIAVWIIGRRVIGIVLGVLGRALTKQSMDPTLIRYIHSAVAALLNVVMVIAILGFFGVETTSFAALIAAAGVAIGMAWSGLLSNFAGGVFLVILQPFKVGDFIAAAGVTGTVEELGLFATTVNTPDNVKTIVGNGKIFGDTIQNFSANSYRRVDLTAQLAHDVEPEVAIALLKSALVGVANVNAEPAPIVELLTFNLSGPVLAVRPYCSNSHYWQVYFDTNRLICDTFAHAGFPVPEQHYTVRRSEDACSFQALILSQESPRLWRY
ncbi:MAG: mechanosensitive ion channel protein MscS [Acidobacteria bacterium]|nr:MAG: mechanosensitive ion channel protein MscS [Acidobacteriota bacterium]